MISKPSLGILLAVATLLVATPANTFAADPQQNKIKKLTKQLQNLPNRAGPAPKINFLVKKLGKLQPTNSGQYFSLGLRKLALPGAQGEAFAKSLSTYLKRQVERSSLSASVKASLLRRLNKIQRLFTPLPDHTPPPYQASLFSPAWVSIT